MREPYYTIRYEFSFAGGERKGFDIKLDSETISLVVEQERSLPDWTRMSYQQCTCCPVDASDNENLRCPIAVNISHLVEEFKNCASYVETEVTCISKERTYLKQTTLQEGLYSIFGIIMATSNCQYMDFLKPMARFHLPFATIEETVVRVTSIYLLSEYFKYKAGEIPDLDLKKLEENYVRLQMVDSGILKRIRAVTPKDSGKNALVVLYFLSQRLSLEIEADLSSINYLFNLPKAALPGLR